MSITIQSGKVNLPDGTYRIKKGVVTSPATVTDGEIKYLIPNVTLEGKCQYKKL